GRIANIGTYNELLVAGVEFHTLQDDIPEPQTGVKSDRFSGLPSANEIHDTAVDHQLITFPNDSDSSRLYQPAGSDKRKMSSQSNPHCPRNYDDYRESSIWNTDGNTQAELAVTQSSEHIMQVTDPDFETLRKRTYSTSEVHDKSQRVRRRTTERESTRNLRKTTPRGSVTSRFAFSLENAISPGIMDYLPSSTTELAEIEDERGPKNQDFFEELMETYEDTAEQEGWQRGSVSWRYYIILGQIGGGLFGVMFTGLLFIGTIANYAGCDVWLAAWSNTVDERQHSNTTEPASNKLILWDLGNNRFNLAVFCVMTGTLVVLSSLRSLSFFAVLINSAKRLHDGMLKAWRILNRFAKDIGQVDDYLPTTIHDFLQCFFLVLSTGVVTIVSSYWVIIPVIPLLVIFYIYRQYYLCASRDLKRIESVARSPMFSWVNVTIQGLPCIRAAGTQPYQLQTFDELVDKHTSVFYANIAAARWLSIRLDLLCWIFITAVVAICLLLGTFSNIAGSSVGLMITYATGLVGLFQWCVRQSAEVENQMVSVERTVEYMDLEPEITQPPVIAPPEGWPKHGKIVFDRLWLRYQTGDTWALKDITLEIRPGLKVGIVGRTGAGKSSLISAIFRLVEAEQGKLLVDDVDVARLELKELRKRISIIPQVRNCFMSSIPPHKSHAHYSSVSVGHASF
ncbi:hypothetical protein P879_06105, partial [Paragonimus westermani]